MSISFSMTAACSIYQSLHMNVSKCTGLNMFAHLSPPMDRSEHLLEEIMRLVVLSVVVSVCLSVCPCTRYDWAGTVAPFCENFYIGGDMHSPERLLVILFISGTFEIPSRPITSILLRKTKSVCNQII